MWKALYLSGSSTLKLQFTGRYAGRQTNYFLIGQLSLHWPASISADSPGSLVQGHSWMQADRLTGRKRRGEKVAQI